MDKTARQKARIANASSFVRMFIRTALDNRRLDIEIKMREERQVQTGKPLTEEEEQHIQAEAKKQAESETGLIVAEAKRLAIHAEILLKAKRAKKERMKKAFLAVLLVVALMVSAILWHSHH